MTTGLAVTVGVFDGVHLGHQALLKAMVQNQQKTLVITFASHPRAEEWLFSLESRIQEIKSLGINEVECLSFDQIKSKTPEEFLDELIERGLTDFFLGYDNHIGKDRSGSPALIKRYLETKGIHVHEIPPILVEETPISSRRIRMLIKEGQLKEAKKLLGKPWGIHGSPLKGLGLGTKIGIPTLNFSFEGLVVPPFGVYITRLKAGNETFNAVANVGIAPTLKTETAPLFELHILDSRPLPPPPYEAIPLVYLREEKTFASTDELKETIHRDIRTAVNFFHPPASQAQEKLPEEDPEK